MGLHDQAQTTTFTDLDWVICLWHSTNVFWPLDCIRINLRASKFKLIFLGEDRRTGLCGILTHHNFPPPPKKWTKQKSFSKPCSTPFWEIFTLFSGRGYALWQAHFAYRLLYMYTLQFAIPWSLPPAQNHVWNPGMCNSRYEPWPFEVSSKWHRLQDCRL